jgi:UDP-glucose 4-epimerase
LENPHGLGHVDLRKIEGQAHRTEGIGRPGFVSGLRIVGHAVSLGTTMTNSTLARSVAITGVSGFIGSRLVPRLSAAGVDRIVGLDIRDPSRGAVGFEHHLVDVSSRDIEIWLRGVDTVVHLAAILDPITDGQRMARANIEGTRRVLDAAAAAGVRKVVRVSTAAVYGAWATNPVPLTEDAPLRPNPGFGPAIHAAESERLVFEWQLDHPDVTVTVLRAAPVLGAGAGHLWARLLAGTRRPRVRGEGAPVQVTHVDDLVDALSRLVLTDHSGVFDVAAPGWVPAEDVRALLPRGSLPALPLDVVRRILSRSWSVGIGEVPPTVLPYLLHPWVVATDRLEALGWRAQHTNEETLLETHEALAEASPPVAATAAIGAGVVAVGVAGALVGRRWWNTHR